MLQRKQCLCFYLGNGRSHEGFVLPSWDLLPHPACHMLERLDTLETPHRDRTILLPSKLKVWYDETSFTTVSNVKMQFSSISATSSSVAARSLVLTCAHKGRNGWLMLI